MKIKAINPNTTLEMTENIGRVADRYTQDTTEIIAVSPERGPVSIESYYDDYLAVPGLLEEILTAEDDIDAFIVACWGDPGIEACREVTDKPVVGIAEASMYMANMLGAKFSVATILPRARDFIEAAVKKTGMESNCASVRCTDLTVIETETAREATIEGLLEVSWEAIEEDGAEVICLGCAGMGGLDEALEAELPVPVIDSVGAAAVLAESLVTLGKSTSSVMTYKRPESKLQRGYPDHFQFSDESPTADD
ncbi:MULTISPECIES: aspartate/glutamate racemase family protein [Haloferax]|uniref:Aspartate/glutamate racemase family protein n=2 Tax=Haloferax TaxID=2251 RepID=A0A6G1Z658_9EURY|nr:MULTISPECIES: aspartate/glutamate racemase family protein [Haloferax]KAB1185467.1 aspartate/glutamate racemase family protein [Haloferax sp. CBA1149]MRW82117.1 aspartate/glutamate racemase family protein [Haloferax marinisediminis]